MKKIILSLILSLIGIVSFAGTKLTSGTLEELAGLHRVAFIVEWGNAVYSKAGSLEDFLDKSVRDDDWENESLKYLFQKVNSRTGEYGLRLVGENDDNQNEEYYFEMEVASISKGGKIKGEIRLKNRMTNEAVATFVFSSDDDDDNDKIAFRDQFRTIGDSLGKQLLKVLKQLKK